MLSILDWYRIAYGVDKPTLTEAVRSNPAYDGIAGQKNLKTYRRWITEVLVLDFFATGRTLENLGLEGMSAKDFQQYLETGNR